MAEKFKQTPVYLKSETMAKLDRLAEKYEISRSQLMRNLIEGGLSDAEMLDNIGVLRFSKLTLEAAERLKKLLNSGKLDSILKDKNTVKG